MHFGLPFLPPFFLDYFISPVSLSDALSYFRFP